MEMHCRLTGALLLTLTVILGGAAPTLAADESVPEVRVLFSGEVQGGFQPCGCAGGPTGGLARRLGYRDEVQKDWNGPLIQIDAGNYLAAPGPNAEIINDLMLKSLDQIPISVMNLGVDDLYWWPRLSKLRQSHTQIISTNLVPRKAGLPVPSRFAILDVPLSNDSTKTLRLGFLGLVDPLRVKPNSGFRALDPVEAVRKVKPELMKKVDALVVLWDLIRPVRQFSPDSSVRKLVEENPEIFLILTTEKRDILYQPYKLGNATVLSGVERGRYMGDLRLQVEANGTITVVDPKFIELKDGSPEDPQMLETQRMLAARLQ
jgi:2',3'-cyclic-nucleotide 2'-phosphodiesterase (5'-nucleotidase family)